MIDFRAAAVRSARPAALAALLVAVAASLPYACTERYRFPPPRPFSGSRVYNPYENSAGTWLKGNFQVSSKSWGGVTDGRDSADAVFDQYRKYGYDVIAVTDYQKIGRFRPEGIVNVTAYEHGFNVRKRHHVVFEPRRTLWFDLPLFQGTHVKQHLIEMLRKDCDMIAIAHPALLGAFTGGDMERLAGYHAMEVINYHKLSVELWDAALSAGRPVWLLASDDSHDVTDLKVTMRCWTMIDAKSAAPADVIAALKAGRAYGVLGRESKDCNKLVSLEVEGDVVTVRFEKPANQIKFFGQGGQARSTVNLVSSASYRMLPEDTYVRVESATPGSYIYLNPVVRCEGEAPVMPLPERDIASTAVMRLCFGVAWLFAAALAIVVAAPRKWFRGTPGAESRALPPAGGEDAAGPSGSA